LSRRGGGKSNNPDEMSQLRLESGGPRCGRAAVALNPRGMGS